LLVVELVISKFDLHIDTITSNQAFPPVISDGIYFQDVDGILGDLLSLLQDIVERVHWLLFILRSFLVFLSYLYRVQSFLKSSFFFFKRAKQFESEYLLTIEITCDNWLNLIGVSACAEVGNLSEHSSEASNVFSWWLTLDHF